MTVIPFTGIIYADESPESVLEKAKQWGMSGCIIVGFNDAKEVIFGGSFSDSGELLLLLEVAKKQVIDSVNMQLEKA